MLKTQNGRQMAIGQRFFHHYENGGYEIRYCCGYCKQCKKKFSLSRGELEEFADNVPGKLQDVLARLVRTRVIFPK